MTKRRTVSSSGPKSLKTSWFRVVKGLHDLCVHGYGHITALVWGLLGERSLYIATC